MIARRVVLLLILPLLPLIAFLTARPVSGAWREWLREWKA